MSPFLATPALRFAPLSFPNEASLALTSSRAAFTAVGHWRFALVDVKLAITFLWIRCCQLGRQGFLLDATPVDVSMRGDLISLMMNRSIDKLMKETKRTSWILMADALASDWPEVTDCGPIRERAAGGCRS